MTEAAKKNPVWSYRVVTGAASSRCVLLHGYTMAASWEEALVRLRAVFGDDILADGVRVAPHAPPPYPSPRFLVIDRNGGASVVTVADTNFDPGPDWPYALPDLMRLADKILIALADDRIQRDEKFVRHLTLWLLASPPGSTTPPMGITGLPSITVLQPADTPL